MTRCIGFYNRGRALEIVTYSEPGFDSIFSGNTTDICPVGALTTADFRFGARPWEMKPARFDLHAMPGRLQYQLTTCAVKPRATGRW